MSYTFRVVFEGVCAYIPQKPFFVPRWYRGRTYWRAQGDPIRSLAVLLPDMRRPGQPAIPDKLGLNFPKFRDPHFPLLKFRLEDLRERTTRRVDLVCRDISERDEAGLLFLRREQIRFEVNGENGRRFSFAAWAPSRARQLRPRLRDRVPDPSARAQLDSLWWLPSMDRISDPYTVPPKVDPDALPSFRGPFPDGLIARVECLGGHLRTFEFNRQVDGSPMIWRFAKLAAMDDDGTWNRAIANTLALEFYDVRDEVRVELRRLANDVVARDLVLAPAAGASRPVLEITISNREPAMLFEQERLGHAAVPDMDFQAFYEKLSTQPSQTKHLPVPYPAKDSFFGIHERPCAGAAMGS